MNHVREKVNSIMSAVLKIPVENSSEITRSETPVWDSLKHVELVFSLEDAFEITFSKDQLANLDTLDKIVDTIEGLKQHQDEA